MEWLALKSLLTVALNYVVGSVFPCWQAPPLRYAPLADLITAPLWPYSLSPSTSLLGMRAGQSPRGILPTRCVRGVKNECRPLDAYKQQKAVVQQSSLSPLDPLGFNPLLSTLYTASQLAASVEATAGL